VQVILDGGILPHGAREVVREVAARGEVCCALLDLVCLYAGGAHIIRTRVIYGAVGLKRHSRSPTAQPSSPRQP
jgi:hypothetical protein